MGLGDELDLLEIRPQERLVVLAQRTEERVRPKKLFDQLVRDLSGADHRLELGEAWGVPPKIEREPPKKTRSRHWARAIARIWARLTAGLGKPERREQRRQE